MGYEVTGHRLAPVTLLRAAARCVGGSYERVEGTIHYAAYPAIFGKENAVVGAVVMAWDLSIHRAEIIGLQLRNGGRTDGCQSNCSGEERTAITGQIGAVASNSTHSTPRLPGLGTP